MRRRNVRLGFEADYGLGATHGRQEHASVVASPATATVTVEIDGERYDASIIVSEDIHVRLALGPHGPKTVEAWWVEEFGHPPGPDEAEQFRLAAKVWDSIMELRRP